MGRNCAIVWFSICKNWFNSAHNKPANFLWGKCCPIKGPFQAEWLYSHNSICCPYVVMAIVDTHKQSRGRSLLFFIPSLLFLISQCCLSCQHFVIWFLELSWVRGQTHEDGCKLNRRFCFLGKLHSDKAVSRYNFKWHAQWNSYFQSYLFSQLKYPS